MCVKPVIAATIIGMLLVGVALQLLPRKAHDRRPTWCESEMRTLHLALFDLSLDDQEMNSYAPTKARAVPRNRRWRSFSGVNASHSEAKPPYFSLNTQTPCPPRGAVPVNQGRTWEAVSFCSCRIAFGDGCDRPNYVGHLHRPQLRLMSIGQQATHAHFQWLTKWLTNQGEK